MSWSHLVKFVLVVLVGSRDYDIGLKSEKFYGCLMGSRRVVVGNIAIIAKSFTTLKI